MSDLWKLILRGVGDAEVIEWLLARPAILEALCRRLDEREFN